MRWEEEDLEEDSEMEEEEEEMDADEQWDGPEWILPYQGTNKPLKRLLVDTRSDLDALHRRVRHIEEDDVRADNKRLKMMLDCSENRTRDAWRELDRATWHYLQLSVDPYVAARDAATAPATDNDDSPTQKETSPSEPQGSPPRDS
ncbi:hypothetical protein Tco_1125432 [Tanacetum coccineum]|uniref:Uncharacterized protein n=1 Tax=Tanacetum coccineum TaxID=301880 RepID=A0ABQ5JBT6_9ASTR